MKKFIYVAAFLVMIALMFLGYLISREYSLVEVKDTSYELRALGVKKSSLVSGGNCNIERLNDLSMGEPQTVRIGDKVIISGWAYDDIELKRSDRVIVFLKSDVKEYFYEASLDKVRSDVVDHYKLPKTFISLGYEFNMPTMNIDPGVYTLHLILPFSKTSYLCPNERRLIISEGSATDSHPKSLFLSLPEIKKIETAYYDIQMETFVLPKELLELTNRLDKHANIRIEPIDDTRILMAISPAIYWFDPSGKNKDLVSPESVKNFKSLLAMAELKDNLRIVDKKEIIGAHFIRSLLLDKKKQELNLTKININDGCVSLNVEKYNIDLMALNITNHEDIFESTPCINSPAALHEYGGVLAFDNKGEVLLTVGGFGLSSSKTDQDLGRPYQMSTPHTYGTIVRLERAGVFDVISIGHRNQQGLAVSKAGAIWSTEHGPKGGDELNLITKGRDYGWPYVSLGLPYDVKKLPHGVWNKNRWSSHSGYEFPTFSWLPSIGVSQIIVYEANHFLLWRGDLIVASLNDRSLRRLKLHNQKVLYDERIEIGQRIRDLKSDTKGRLLIVTDEGSLIRLSLDKL